MNVRLPRFNHWLRANGLGDGIRIDVGLNSGPFMSGNVGSLRRLEYTVHGDTVNTASRIESMTKTIGRAILLADSTRDALLRAQDDLEHVGEFEVRGRESRRSRYGPSKERRRSHNPSVPGSSPGGPIDRVPATQRVQKEDLVCYEV